VDNEVLLQAGSVHVLRLDREADVGVAADVLDLLVLAEARDDDLVTFEAAPDQADLRRPVLVQRYEVDESR
jgi:hypothetical protein